MKLSNFFAPTLKEDPAEAEIISHRLLVRAGLIRKLTSGIYTFLPLGLKALNKVANIVREEMDRAGCIEILMPMVQPAEIWQQSGRWNYYGRELLRFKDRHDRDYCLGPTHEEVITQLIASEVKSYRQLPLNLYQIQTKFRDEIRPRFGLMRCREFIMKDGYSFDLDEQGAQVSYQKIYQAYTRAFERLGLNFRAVEADSGAIGGSYSHEFMVLAETGEDTIATCTACSYAANLERAAVRPRQQQSATIADHPQALELVSTPNAHTVEEVANMLKVPKHKIIKTLILNLDGQAVAALIPGNRELNEVKLKNFLGGNEIRMANNAEVEEWAGAPQGFAGPVDLQIETIVADQSLNLDTDWVTGANQKDAHFRHVDLKRDTVVKRFTDLCVIEEHDPCPKCGGKIEFFKGIEVGHVFKLGTKYSQALGATYLDPQGKEKTMVMGCYGIGVSRIIAAAIEQNHDQHGIIFPPSIAPFEIHMVCLNPKDKAVLSQGEAIYQALQTKGLDVLFDDRDLRPGFKFKDADLLGSPIQLIIGTKGLAKGIVEGKERKTGQRIELPLDNFEATFQDWRVQIWNTWGLAVPDQNNSQR